MTEEITKRRVTMTRYSVTVGEGGEPITLKEEAVDYVRQDHVDAYAADARTKWAHVEVSADYDAGPGGYHGETVVPEHLDLPDAGTTYAATTPEEG